MSGSTSRHFLGSFAVSSIAHYFEEVVAQLAKGHTS